MQEKTMTKMRLYKKIFVSRCNYVSVFNIYNG